MTSRLSSARINRTISRAIIETLENRRMLAANVVTAALGADGTLSVTGTRGADVINVALNQSDPSQIDVSAGETLIQSFAASGVTSVHIDSGNGDDVVTVGSGLNVPVSIFGGNGHDSIGGSDGDDHVDGGKGNDDLGGNGGDDFIEGGKGNDTVGGGAGDDDCKGGAGNDVMAGGTGDDSVRGEAGNDDCDGDDGDDNVDGGKGNDDVDGGDDDDFATGGTGNDSCQGGSGDDDVDGGVGNDDVDGDDGDDRVRGGKGNDDCDGGENDDSVSGGVGHDSVHGGGGADDFDDDDDEQNNDDDDDDDNGDDFDEDEGDGFDDDEHIPVSEVPADVLSAFNTQFPDATIREVERETEDGTVIYKIDFLDTNGLRHRAFFTDAGAPVPGGDEDDEQISFDDLPTAVQASFNSLFPGATVGEVERETEDEGLEFEIDFVDASNVRRRAEFAEDGTLLEQEVR